MLDLFHDGRIEPQCHHLCHRQIAAFAIGGIPFGYLVGRLVLKDDIRRHGSGNIGATNVARVIGWRWGGLVLVLDAFKGLLPTLATFKELGYAQMEIYAWTGFLAPAGTPPAIIQKLNREFTAALRLPDAQAKLRAIDLEPIPNSPEEFAAMMKADTERWRDTVKASGFKAD